MKFDIKLARRKIRQLIGSPMWVNSPESVQLDTQNKCNLDCIYCNVQKKFDNPKGEMPLQTIKFITEYFKGYDLWCIAPFMNGDPLLEERLPTILDLISESGQSAVLDTNGTFTKNLKILIHPNLKLVRFTISACTPETYEKVHGKRFFETALSNLRWFTQNKLPTQKVWINYIENKHNQHETEDFLKFTSDYDRTVFPIHSSHLKPASQEVKTQSKLVHYLSDGKKSVPDYKYHPCSCWGILSVSWDGRILQCDHFPYEYNYGKVGEVDLISAWKERNKNKMDNPCCNSCNLRLPDWKKKMDKYIK